MRGHHVHLQICTLPRRRRRVEVDQSGTHTHTYDGLCIVHCALLQMCKKKDAQMPPVPVIDPPLPAVHEVKRAFTDFTTSFRQVQIVDQL